MITIIIPSCNGEAQLKILIPSLLKQTYKEYKLILVDNASNDGSIEYVTQEVPNSIILRLNTNCGFAKAVNEGIRYSLNNLDSEYILLLNNDIELDPNFLIHGVEVFKNVPNASFVAGKMLNYYNREVIDDCGDSIKTDGGSPRARGHSEKDTGQYNKEEFIFGACAGAALYKKEIFEKVGLFDEDFFAYYEDIDLSFRAQLKGYKCYYDPKLLCYHMRGGTSSIATYGFQTEHCERNLVLMRFKNYPLGMYLLYQPLFFAARLRRYYTFIKDYSFSIFLKALKGYFKGLFRLPFQLRKRHMIQKSKKVKIGYIRNLSIK